VDKPQTLCLNKENIGESRSRQGRIASFGDALLLPLTTTWAKSGQRRTNPTMYLADELDRNSVFIFASFAGGDQNPAWFHNVVAHPDDIEVQLGKDRNGATPKVLPEPRRAEVYAIQASRYPASPDTKRRRRSRSQRTLSRCGDEWIQSQGDMA
jgi:deazaflavin-dependent oxidoreductase (nitroreductase family)